MNDIVIPFKRRGISYTIRVRYWWWHLSLRILWDAIWNGTERYGTPVFYCHITNRSHDSPVCYCEEGSQNSWSFQFLGVGFHLWFERDWVARPCPCDKMLWVLSPELHEDEIDDYGGLAKLQAELGVKP